MPSRRLAERCFQCGRTRLEVYLDHCIICRRAFCRTCGIDRHGKRFCSIHCAGYFFFGEEEGKEEEDGEEA